MTHHNHIHIVVYHLDGVLQGLALALTRVGGVRESDYLGSKTVDCSLKTQSRSCRGLKKQARDHLALQEVLLPVLLEFFGSFKYVQDFLLCEIPDGN